MKNPINSVQLIKLLKTEKINTWFDLGLFIDRFREEKDLKTEYFSGTYNEYNLN